MRRFVLWIIVIMSTFMIGVGIDRALQYFSATDAPAPARFEPVAIYFPQSENDIAQTVTALTPTEPAKPRPILILDYDQEKFHPAGVFHAIGPIPREFAEIDCIEVGIIGVTGVGRSYISVHALNEPEADSADVVFALVTERRLFFVTEQMPDSGFEYRFDGEFLHTDFEAVSGTNTVVLRGTLTKTRNGQTIAERTVSFRVQPVRY